jgi:glycine hydroxymethyltransferase
MSGKYYKVVPYGVSEKDCHIDYDALRKTLGMQAKMIIAGASAYSRIIDFKAFREICDEVAHISW